MRRLIRDFDPAAFIAPLKLRRVDAVGRVALACTRLLLRRRRLRAGRRRTRRHRHRARHLHRRARQPRRVSGRPDRARADRRAGDSVQQHRLERAGQPLRDRVRAARSERHVQSARGVEPRARSRSASARFAQGRTTAMVTGGADCVEETFFKVHDRFRALSPMRGIGRRRRGGASVRSRPQRLHSGRRRLPAAARVGVRGRTRVGRASTARFSASAPTASKTALNGWPRDGAGLVKAMRLALSDAKLGADEVAAVMATANGSPLLDRLEAEAIVEVFGRQLDSRGVGQGCDRRVRSGGRRESHCRPALDRRRQRRADGWLRRAGSRAVAVRVSGRAQPIAGETFLVNSVASGGTNYSLASGAPGLERSAPAGIIRASRRSQARRLAARCWPCGMDDLTLTGRVAVVTGGSRGIGRAIAVALARARRGGRDLLSRTRGRRRRKPLALVRAQRVTRARGAVRRVGRSVGRRVLRPRPG